MKFWSIKAKDDKKENIEFSIYGDISDTKFWEDDVTPKQIKDELDAFPNAKKIFININSGGGSAFAGVAIYNLLKRHKAEKTVYIDGLAASAASVIAMCGDKIIMPQNAMMMIHNAWMIYAGNSKDFLKAVVTLEGVDNAIAETYQKRTGQDIEKIKEMMDAETWLSHKEAKELGFCDESEEAKAVAASIQDGVLNVNGITVKASDYKNFPSLKIKKVIEIEQNEEQTHPKSQTPTTGDDIKKYLEDITK